MAGPVRVVIVDDHELILEGLAAALETYDDLMVVLTANSVASYTSQAKGVDFDVVVTDLVLGDGSGSEVANFTNEQIGRPVLLMTGQGDAEGVQAAIESGCAGFVSKAANLDALSSAIRIVAAGGSVFPAALLRQAMTGPTADSRGITEREMAVLVLLAEGRSAAEIAAAQVVSVHTIRNHIQSLLTKLHAKSQLEAVVRAVGERLVAIG